MDLLNCEAGIRAPKGWTAAHSGQLIEGWNAWYWRHKDGRSVDRDDAGWCSQVLEDDGEVTYGRFTYALEAIEASNKNRNNERE